MGRKDLTAERTSEILVAFERCVIKYGLEASLEQIAEEAGMTRSIIRHYIGNRDEVVRQLIESITTQFLAQLRTASNRLSSPERVLEDTLNYLFSGNQTVEEWEKPIIQVLMSARERYPEAKRQLKQMFEELLNMLAHDLAQIHPQNSASRYHQVAYSILCLTMMNNSFMELGMERTYNTIARQQAEILISTL